MRSLWLQEALAGEDDSAPLEREEHADICIVGGGYTGLWTALKLKEHDPSLDVVIVEADVCGGGASGRNGGFVMSWWSKFLKLEHLCGQEEALRLARASAEAVSAIGVFCEAHSIGADFREDGWLWAATKEAQIGAWEETVVATERAGAEAFVRLDPDEAGRRAGSPTHIAGVFEPTCATVQPARLARGLRRVALEQGIRIFEHSPMTRLERSFPARVHTTLGSVTADKVVLAMNAWLVQVRELSRSLAVIASDMIATERVPARLEEIGLTTGIAISDSRMLVNYYRTTVDGRIAFGKGGGALARRSRIGAEFSGASPRAGDVAESFRELYPALADVDVPASWTGPIDRSLDGLPFFGTARREVGSPLRRRLLGKRCRPGIPRRADSRVALAVVGRRMGPLADRAGPARPLPARADKRRRREARTIGRGAQGARGGRRAASRSAHDPRCRPCSCRARPGEEELRI